jgi:nitrite reductase/ring-hydroxylating ferredoxin subunit
VAGYQRVAALSDIPARGCLAIEVEGRPVVLVRRGDKVTALENRCPHAGAPLSEGFLEGCQLTCSWHGWTFDVDTGISVDDPELVVPTFPVMVEGTDVLVDVPPVPA